jgi:hypothetical protein
MLAASGRRLGVPGALDGDGEPQSLRRTTPKANMHTPMKRNGAPARCPTILLLSAPFIRSIAASVRTDCSAKHRRLYSSNQASYAARSLEWGLGGRLGIPPILLLLPA